MKIVNFNEVFSRISGIFHWVLMFSLPLVFIQCQKDKETNKFDGTYDLRTVNGSALPFDVVVPPPYIREIEYVLVISGGTYTQTRTRLFGSLTPTIASTSGSCTVNGGMISLLDASYIGSLAPGQSKPPITGGLNGQTLTLKEGAHEQLPPSSGYVLVLEKR